MMAKPTSSLTALLCVVAAQTALFGALVWLSATQKLGPGVLAAAGILTTGALMALGLQLCRRQAAAQRASRRKSAFLTHINHELRTPLAGVIANLELLRGGDLSREQRDLVEGCMAAGKGLLGIIGNTLDLAKIEASRLSLAPTAFDLRDMVNSVASIYRSAALDKQTELSTVFSGPVPRRVVADELRLRQVLCNLVGNAVKFTQAGHIRLSLQAERIDAQTVCLHFVVEDDGIGFSAAAAATLFQPFGQADRDAGGSGLGLAISKQLVALHGGEISCTAEPGAGASFKVSLKLPVAEWEPLTERDVREAPARRDPAPQRSGSLSPQPFAPGKAPSLLVVEDQPMNRRILQRQLKVLGIDCDLAENGPEALTLLDHRHYDVFITDCALPGMDGLELIRRIRAEEKAASRSRSLILVLTANAIEGMAQASRAAGADVFLTKPLKLADLAATLMPDTSQAAAAPAPRAAARPAPIDRATLAELIGRDEILAIDRLARDFFFTWQGSLAAVEACLHRHDAAGLAEAAHAAKGNAQYAAAAGLAAASARLEEAAHAGRWEDCAAALEALKIETGRLQSHLIDTGVIGHDYRRSA